MKIYKEDIGGRAGYTVWDDSNLLAGPFDSQGEADDWISAREEPARGGDHFISEVVIPRQDHVALQVLADKTVRLTQENLSGNDQVITIVGVHNLDLLISALQKARASL